MGRLPPNTYHGIPVAALSINLERYFEFFSYSGNKSYQARSVFCPPNLIDRHNVTYGKGIMAFLWMEPNFCHSMGKKSMRHKAEDVYYSLENEDEVIHLLSKIYSERPDAQIVEKMIDESLGNLSFDKSNSVLDMRVIDIMKLIKENPSRKISLEELMDIFKLSRPYLMQLFKEKTGMPIGKFQLWVKMIFSLRLVLSGSNVTEAALMGGFSDAAHFSRTFKSMAGVSVSSIF